MTRYKAALVALDGGYVTDFLRDDVDAVQAELADMGSRWFFYPVACVIESAHDRYTDAREARIVDGAVCECVFEMHGVQGIVLIDTALWVGDTLYDLCDAVREHMRYAHRQLHTGVPMQAAEVDGALLN